MLNLAAAVVLVLSGFAPADSDAGSEAIRRKAWLNIFARQAVDYRLSPAARPGEKFKLLPNPIFRHSAPSRGSDDLGAVWLWVYPDGRPAVIGTIFGWSVGGGYREVTHEFHSLAPEPITGTWRQAPRWLPGKAGLVWKPIPKAPTPAESPRKRLLQLRQLASRFQAYSINPQGSRWQLRLIPRPVYNYQLPDGSDTLSGALFLICQDTNTDVILSIEARRVGKAYQWCYGCASFADWQLHVLIDDTEVWTDPDWLHASRSPRDVHWVRRSARVKLPNKIESPAAGA